MTTLVTGATGAVGRAVVDQLLRAGADVRALTRNPAAAKFGPDVQVVAGDLAAPATLAPALRGVDRMYLFPIADAAQEVVALARRAGVRRIVVLSAAAVTIGLATEPVEEAVEASGLEWTHVRPGEFMMNRLHLWGPSIRAERVVRYPFADEAGVPVHEADIAAVAVRALLDDGHAGHAYTLTGPAPITARDQVRAIGAALGTEVRFEQVTPEQARRLLRAQGGFAGAYADFLLGFVGYDSAGADPGAGQPAPDDYSELLRPWPTVEQVTGRPARSFAEWARDHATDFR